jgi:hypothetical protein
MKKDKWHPIEALPSVHYEPDYESVFLSIQYPRVQILPSDPQEHARLKLIGGQWLIWLHWVVKKKWLSKHKIPVSREVAKLYEPKGEYLYRLLEICIQVHASRWGEYYNNNGLAWFGYIVKTERDANIRHVLNNEAKNETYSQGGYGRAFRDDQRQIIAQLENLQNPWHPELSPHHHRIMAAALELEVSDIFLNNYWKPFLKAYRGWIRSLDSPNWAAAWVEGNHLKCQAGRGKGSVNISSSL